MSDKKKIFVLDTNVILHDYDCLQNFQNNDIVIPITVLEELDGFKRGHDQIHFNSRQFIRILDDLAGEKLVRDGVSLGPGRGTIKIITNHQMDPRVNRIFSESHPDHRILSVTLGLTEIHKDRQVILVSKDVNLRLKAKSLNLKAEDYSTDRIQDIDKLYKGMRTLTACPSPLIARLYREEGSIPREEMGMQRLHPNEYMILKNQSKSALAYVSAQDTLIHRVEKASAYGIVPRNAEQTFALHALLNPEVLLVTVSGKAGTGKTLLALAAALEVRRFYHQIFLARPIVPLSNRDLGYLPGDLDAKLDPYMQPLYDNLYFIRNQFQDTSRNYKRIGEMLQNDKLHISPLAYIRGRSLERIFFIVDEAQNLTPHEVKTIITRAGEGTKVIFTGDFHQIDTPYLDAQSNGLTYLIDHMKGQPLYAHVHLEKGERSRLAELASDLL